jgi:hypothetical protein
MVSGKGITSAVSQNLWSAAEFSIKQGLIDPAKGNLVE